MCGIFGWVAKSEGLEADKIADARQATAKLAHRGPDHQGEWHDKSVFMGHRRLSIIDLSQAAHQPFQGVDGRFVLAYNGEVYNYLELQDELRNEGEVFATHSDTEVVLAAIRRWGTGALSKFDGMFAFALHDRQSGRHLLARDFLGQKPLYYAVTEKGLVYASELSPLLELPGFSFALDRAAFRRFLLRGYYGWDETPIREIRKLPPGHLLFYENGQARLERYWHSVPGENSLDIGEDEAVAELDRLLARSCREGLRSDVPYGVFLSGGIDSSLVLAYCHDVQPDIRAFCVGMGEKDFDESSKADLMIRHLGIKQAKTFIMDGEAVQASLERVFTTLDEPHGDPGYVNAAFLAASCRPHLTVALAGDGGDELFAGYAPFAGLLGAALLAALPDFMIALIKRSARLVPASDTYLNLRFKLDAYLRGFPSSDPERFDRWLSGMDESDCRALSGDAGNPFADLPHLLKATAKAGRLDQLLHYYQTLFLPEFVCLHTDRAAMRSSLEVRAPLLSRPLIEFANRLPAGMKMPRGNLKHLLKRLAEKKGLPPAIIAQKKQGFTFPVARWLKGPLKSRLQALTLRPGWSQGLIDQDVLGRMIDEHLAGTANHYRTLYHLMAFQAWRERYPTLGLSDH
ncbi:MAG: asparagine synthase (glutamine-hydrolyzing) [Alphaproteobacteria bacterium]|nr:asparagine synthase (glutamine-hydrolyzing) [Alphaproteobacteria bacterium]